MKLASYLPSNSSLGRSKLYDGPAKRKRLTLAIPHVVSGKIGGRERVGEADIFYNIDFVDKISPGAGLDTSSSLFIGVQSMDYLTQVMQDLRPRTSYAVQHVANGKFDMRALLFVLGACNAAGVAGSEVTFEKRPSSYATLSTGWSVPDVGQVVFGPNVAQTPEEFVTFLAMCGDAGVASTTLLSDRVPASEARLLTGRALATFSFRAAMNILNVCRDVMCYGSHRLAFECGKTAVMTLSGHSGEGGWIRKLMQSVHYPPSTGIVPGMGTELHGYPLQESMQLAEAMRTCVAGYLEVIALLHPADVLTHGNTSVYTRDSESDGRPGDYGIFVSDAYNVLSTWRDLVCDMVGEHHDGVVDDTAYVTFFGENAVDRHFSKYETISPWWFVDPSPLLATPIPGYVCPAQQGEVTTLPLFSPGDVSYDSPVLDDAGRVMPGTSVWLSRTGGTYREEGAHYLLSSRYSQVNGLSQFTEAPNLDGSVSGQLAFSDNRNANLAGKRWITPHNPLPHPVEGLADGKVTMKYRSVDITSDFTPAEAQNGRVESRFGMFRVTTESPADDIVTHRSVPRTLRKLLRGRQQFFGEILSLTIKTLGGSAVVRGVPESPDEQDPAGQSLTATEAVQADEADALQPLLSATPADTGVSPKTPTVRGGGRKDSPDASSGGAK